MGELNKCIVSRALVDFIEEHEKDKEWDFDNVVLLGKFAEMLKERLGR